MTVLDVSVPWLRQDAHSRWPARLEQPELANCCSMPAAKRKCTAYAEPSNTVAWQQGQLPAAVAGSTGHVVVLARAPPHMPSANPPLERATALHKQSLPAAQIAAIRTECIPNLNPNQHLLC